MAEHWRMEGGGTLSLKPEGIRVRLEAVRPEDGRGLYKVWVRGTAGELLLGTLIPAEGSLRLQRVISRTTLEQAGCWPVTGGRCTLTFPFEKKWECGPKWTAEPNPGRLCSDQLLRQLLWEKPGFFRAQRGDIVALSTPFRSDRPFPLVPLFCLAEVERMQNQFFLVWQLDQEGRPLVPHNDKKGGTY